MTTPAEELRTAVLALTEGGEPLTREVIEPLVAWLDACANDIGSITPLAGDLDLFVFCDEPSSVRRAVAVARVINGGGER